MRNRTNACCVSVQVMVAVLSASALCKSAACEELPPESFSQAEAYQKLLRTHQVKGTSTDRLSGEQEFVRYEQVGDQVVRSENLDGSTDVSVRNHAYYFRVIRPVEGGKWNVVYVNQQKDESGSYTRPCHAGTRLGFAMETVWGALQKNHLDVVNITAASDDPNSDVTVKMVRSEQAPADFRVDSGTFVFSREHYWLIKEARLSETLPNGGSGVVRIEHEISICEPLDLPVISKKKVNGVYMQADPSGPEVILNYEIDYAFDKLIDDDPNRFKLTRFGLPEPD
ncbi:MAG: hypothetical protein AAGI63_09960 [Planctomycetota bacterium]